MKRGEKRGPRFGEGFVLLRGSRWWISHCVRGKERREAAMVVDRGRMRPAASREEAERALQRVRRAVHGGSYVPPKVARATVSDLLDALEVHLRDVQHAKSLPQHSSHSKPVREALGARRAVDLTSGDVLRFRTERGKLGKADATINREVGILRQAYRLAMKQGVIPSAPHFVMAREENAREGFFERDDFEAVVANLPAHIADVARFGYLTGWRKAEILALSWERIDRQAREIRLATSKNGRPRVLRAAGPLWELVERRHEARRYTRQDGTEALSEYVFHAGDGRQIVDFKRSWATACKKAGCPGRLFHDLRRTAARDMVRAGVPQAVAMTVTGHRTASMFQRYNITSDADTEAALVATDAYRAALPSKVERGAFGS